MGQSCLLQGAQLLAQLAQLVQALLDEQQQLGGAVLWGCRLLLGLPEREAGS